MALNLPPKARPWLIGGVVVGGGLLGWSYYRQKKNAATAASTDTSSADTSGTSQDMSAYDPNADYGAYTYGADSGLGGFDQGGGYYGAGSVFPTAPPETAVNNAQWSEAAVSALTEQGYEGQAVLAALGVYLTGGTVSAQQASIVQAAIAAEGYPPVDGPSGFPPGIRYASAGGGGGGGNVPGKPGAISVTPYSHYADFSWGAVSGVHSYQLVVQPAGGRNTGTTHYDQVVTGTHQRVDLEKGRYQARVRVAGNAHAPYTAWKSFTIRTLGPTHPPK